MHISSKNVVIGNSGWSMIRPQDFAGLDWKKKYKSLLTLYASLFDAAEVNFTFYQLPRISIAGKWLSEVEPVNKNFEFTVKASRIITHTRKFEGQESLDAYDAIREFTLALGAKVILFQSPVIFKPTGDNVRKMKDFFGKINREGVALAWEPRNHWYDDEKFLKDFLKELDLIHVVDPLRNGSLYQGKGEMLYFRLHGFGQPSMYMWQFTDGELKKIFDIIENTPAEKAYVMFNNTKQYEDSLRFKNLLKS